MKFIDGHIVAFANLANAGIHARKAGGVRQIVDVTTGLLRRSPPRSRFFCLLKAILLRISLPKKPQRRRVHYEVAKTVIREDQYARDLPRNKITSRPGDKVALEQRLCRASDRLLQHLNCARLHCSLLYCLAFTSQCTPGASIARLSLRPPRAGTSLH